MVFTAMYLSFPGILVKNIDRFELSFFDGCFNSVVVLKQNTTTAKTVMLLFSYCLIIFCRIRDFEFEVTVFLVLCSCLRMYKCREWFLV